MASREVRIEFGFDVELLARQLDVVADTHEAMAQRCREGAARLRAGDEQPGDAGHGEVVPCSDPSCSGCAQVRAALQAQDLLPDRPSEASGG